jgi:hypothetical protein
MKFKHLDNGIRKMASKINKLVSDLVQTEITEIINKISQHFNISIEEIKELIKKDEEEPKIAQKTRAKPKPKSEEESNKEPVSLGESIPEDVASLAKYTKAQLAGICKKKGLKVSGTNSELMNRIIDSNREGEGSSSSEPLKTVAKKTVAKKAAVKSEPSILKKITQVAPVIQIKRNSFGNYEHTESHLVFDKEDRVVIGRQMSDGIVIDIDDNDIEICKKYKFDYRLPENLDKNKKNADDVIIDEMGEEELNEEDFEEPVEEEEELSDEEVDE